MSDAGANVIDMAEVKRLAEMSPLEYERERTDAARKLGVRRPHLDSLVRKAKPQEEKVDAKKAQSEALQLSLDMLVSSVRLFAQNNNIRFGYTNGSWYIYRDGTWRVFLLSDREDFDRILQSLCPEVGLVFGKDAGMIEKHLRSSMHFKLDANAFDQSPYVAMQNGSVNLDTGELEAHRADHMITRFIDIAYDPSATCDGWEQMLLEVLGDYDEDARKQIAGFLQEWMGVALVGGSSERTPRELRKALFLYGPPRAGKSTLYDVIRQLLGTDKIVASKVSEINSRFGLEAFLSASAWITEEVEDVRRDVGTSRVKCLITGEPVTAQRKGTTDVILKFKGLVGWAGNTAPKFSEASSAVYDRIVTIPMERSFTPDEARAKFGKKKPVEWLYEKGEFPGIFNWALAGYNRLLARGRFEEIKSLLSARDAWREQNDVTFDFIRNYTVEDPKLQNNTEVLALAVLAYAKEHSANTWPDTQSIKTSLASVVPEAFPSVKKKRRQTVGGKFYTYQGLALTEAGLAYFEKATADSIGSKALKLKPNEPVLFRPASEAE